MQQAAKKLFLQLCISKQIDSILSLNIHTLNTDNDPYFLELEKHLDFSYLTCQIEKLPIEQQPTAETLSVTKTPITKEKAQKTPSPPAKKIKNQKKISMPADKSSSKIIQELISRGWIPLAGRGKGSHSLLAYFVNGRRTHSVTIPHHKQLKPGTLARISRQINNFSLEEEIE